MANQSTSAPPNSPPAPGGNNRLDGRYLFTAALVAARKGRYAEALGLLRDAMKGGACSEDEAWDLQARIYAQQGMYLHAESCWRNAQRLDGSNVAYADALARVRQVRLPIWHLRQVLGVAFITLILLLLFWQILLFKLDARTYQGMTNETLSSMRDDIDKEQNIRKSRDVELADGISTIEQNVRQIDATLSDRLGKTSTSNPIIGEMNERIALLEHNIAGQLSELDKRRIETEAAQLAELDKRRIETEAANAKRLAQLDAAIAQIEQTLSTAETANAKQADDIRSGFQRDLKPLATSAEMSGLTASITELQQRVDRIADAVRKLRIESATTAPSSNSNSTTQPTH